MVKGLYTGWTGMVNEQKRLDLVSNNLANASTIGFKKDSSTSQSFDQQLQVKIKDASSHFINKPIGSFSYGVKLGEVYTDHTQGSMRETGNSFDFAIDGKGFFALNVVNSSGNTVTQYTRDGSFTMTSEGFITDANGNRVLGESGEITLPIDGNETTVDSSGRIFVDNQYIDTMQIVDFENYDYLSKQGETRYIAVEGATTVETNASVYQGFTEQSNINVVTEMVEMISITRAYEANQKVIQSIDSTLEQAVNSVGKV